VTVPPFAESVSEGDVRWEKGKQVCYNIIITAATTIIATAVTTTTATSTTTIASTTAATATIMMEMNASVALHKAHTSCIEHAKVCAQKDLFGWVDSLHLSGDRD
jgi:hypothetical protein